MENTMIELNENKYFTPLIEDIRVGYECEFLHKYHKIENDISIYKEEWLKPSINWSNITLYVGETMKKLVRVPYLTKEQIEAEGWETEDAKIGDQLVWGSRFIATKKVDDTTSYKVSFERDNRVFIQRNITNIESNVIPMSLFSGECKDINTFRYICKLLGI